MEISSISAQKKEVIGNITLNLDYYKGEDLYSEGDAEDMLLDLVSRFTENDYEHIIQNSKSWNVMYHLCHIRENIVTWLPIPKTASILEIGAGCGAVTGGLARLGAHVDCVELSKKRSTINATRHRDYSNIDIIVGNYADIEPHLPKYDVITLIGVLEYAGSYIDSKEPYLDLLKSAARHLAPGGKLIVAIENKFGLKYFAGCKEDHTGRYFEGIEGYRNNPGVRTFSKGSLVNLISDLGLSSKFYYPYPDYKLPHTIYSDDMLPGEGELNTNLRNFDNDRVVLFDETRAFDSIIEEGTFDYFANSYLVVMSNVGIYDAFEKVPIFAKYANERRADFRTSTILTSSKDGTREVYKCAINNESNSHIQKIAYNYERFTKAYAGKRLVPNKCELIKGVEPIPLVIGATSKSIDKLKLEYLSGQTMESYLFELCDRGEFEELERLIKRYVDEVCALSDGKPFEKTDFFNEVFGRHEFDPECTGDIGSDYDLIFSNIVFDENDGPDGVWNVLDYEWTFDFPIPDKFVAFRGLYYFFEQSNVALKEYYEERGIDVYEMFGFSEDEVTTFKAMEHHFQVNIIGGVASLEVLHAIMPTNTVFLDTIMRESNALKNINNPKIYYSYGEGYSDERQIYIIPDINGARIKMDIPLANNMRGIRIDPTEYNSVVCVKELYFIDKSGQTHWIDKFMMNGYMVSDRTIVYNTNDAQIIVDEITADMKTLHIAYDVSMFLPEMYEDIRNLAIKKEALDYPDPTFGDRLLMKLHLKKRPAALPKGYHYNVAEHKKPKRYLSLRAHKADRTL